MAIYKSTYASRVFPATTQKIDDPSFKGNPFNFGTSFTLTTSHTSGDIIALFPLSSNSVVRALLLSTDGAATAGAMDVGLYTFNKGGDTATAVDADLFASAQAITSAATRTDITNESTNFPLTSRFLPLWDTVSGLTQDPSTSYWVCGTITTNVDATNVIAVEAIGVS